MDSDTDISASEPAFERMRVEGYVCPSCATRVWPAPARASMGTGAGAEARAEFEKTLSEMDEAVSRRVLRAQDDEFLPPDIAYIVARTHLLDLYDAASVTRPPVGEPTAWRCFHCDEVFTIVEDARQHFGESELDEPGCVEKLNGKDSGLLATVRELEVRNHELLKRAQEAELAEEVNHGLRAELTRYFGTSNPWLIYDRYDCARFEAKTLRDQLAAPRSPGGEPD